jgi:uncharacterized protein
MVTAGCSSARPAGTATTGPPGTAQPASSGAARVIPLTVGTPPLRGTLTLPPGRGPFPAMVLVSGSGANDQDETVQSDKPFRDLAFGLATRGIATLRYDKRTLDDPGAVDPKTFTATDEYVPDALTAISLLAHRGSIDPRRIFVLGHSQGGTFAPRIAQRAPQVAGLVLMAASVELPGTALLRETRYLATLPPPVGPPAAAQVAGVAAVAKRIDSPSLAGDPSSTVLLGGVGPAYYLDLQHYDPVATARSVPQPLLVLQGDRDYEVTVTDDLDAWTRGLAGRAGVTVVQFPEADHLFVDGQGPPTPEDYDTPGVVDPAVVSDIAEWVGSIH